MAFVDETLHEHEEIIKKQFKDLMIQKGSKKIEVRNGDNEPYNNKPRAFVSEGEFAKIYNGLRENLVKRSLYKFKIDKDKFISDCCQYINNNILLLKSAQNEYTVKTGKGKFNASAMFLMEETAYADKQLMIEVDTITEDDFEEEWRVFKAKSDGSSAMNEYYKMDSEGETEFAHRLENNENVLMFTKLKKGGFVIDTPYGNYSPDWAVVCRKDTISDSAVGIYFIVETKFGKNWDDLTDVERNKIHCGKVHFEAVSDNIEFKWVNSYENFRQKFCVPES
jgi:restriction endonuclease